MKRKVHHWQDDGTLEFYPSIDVEDDLSWMGEERRNSLPEIDDDELVQAYIISKEETNRLYRKIMEKAT